MPRCTSLFGAILLVLMLWTGGAAHAAEQFACAPVTTEAAEQNDGNEGSSPASPNKCVTHNHGGCAGHHLAAQSSTPSIELAQQRETASFARQEVGIPGLIPDNDLRPPIA